MENFGLPTMVRFIFTNYERDVLLKLIVQHHEVLGCRDNSGGRAKAKIEAWTDITDRFNATEGVRPCNFKQLKKCWDNIKARAKAGKGSFGYSQEDQILGKNEVTEGTPPADHSSVSLDDSVGMVTSESFLATNEEDTDAVQQTSSLLVNGGENAHEEEPLSLIVPRKRLYQPDRNAVDEQKPKIQKFVQDNGKSGDVGTWPAKLSSRKQTNVVELTDLDMRKKEHSAKMLKLKMEQEYMEKEHVAKMELVKAQTEYYKQKLKHLNTSTPSS